VGWNRISEVKPPVNRPILVRTLEADDPIVAFLGSVNVWYAGGALVRGSTTVLSATPMEWCEPDGDHAL
jgi:hypothetical protein